jgi:biopolymer transport protein ExbD
MKMKGAKAVHYEAGPNMTPLVDVVMVILIFLMLAGKFGGQEHFLVSNMPISGKGGGGATNNAVSIDEPLEIRVDSPSPDRFVAQDSGGKIKATDGEDLYGKLLALKKQMNDAGKQTKDIQVKIAPTKRVKYLHVVAVHEAAVRADFEKIGFTAAQ